MSQSAVRSRSGPPARTGARYDEDLYTWVQEQVALVRVGQLDEIDAENIAEELSDVGKSEFSKLQSALEIIPAQMLKWDHQPEKRTRSWDNSKAAPHRGHHEDVLRDNPGLKSRRDGALARAYRQARLRASSETGLARSTFPEQCPYSWDEILSGHFDFDPPSTARKGR